MAELITFPVEVQLGKYYFVPHVINSIGEWIPINSHLHEDTKVIKFSLRHWHVDWRFVRKEMYTSELYPFNQTNYYSLMEVKTVLCLVESDGEWGGLRGRWWTTDATIMYKKVMCKRAYGAKEFHNDHPLKINQWPSKLAKVFCQSKLKKDGDTLICPHKGILIDRNCKDEQGNYVCPGHLLRFNPETLTIIQ